MNTSIIPLLLTGCAASSVTMFSDENEESMYATTSEKSSQAMDDNSDSVGLGASGSGLGGGGIAEGIGALGTRGSGSGSSGYGSGGAPLSAPAPPPKRSASAEPAPAVAMSADTEEPAQTRAWFPETFLFAPLVVTDETGSASHPVVVPDRLTNWRVLGLAHGADGALAGDLLTFRGTLPVYVDPILPPFLRAGDELLVPIQAVNTTATAQQLALTIRTEGVGRFGPTPSAVTIGAGGSAVVRAPLLTTKAGELTVYAALGSEDAVERTVPVLPTGRPLLDTRAGSLAAPRSFTIVSPFDADPDSARSRLVVYPGALAVLRSELDNASQRGGMAGDAYALLLSGQASALLERLGGESDPEGLRELSIVTTQRATRHARAPDVATATLLAQAALAHPDNPVLARMGMRLIDLLISAQRPDGTFEGGAGWTLQRLMVTTADAVRAANAATSFDDDPRRARQVTLMQLKASGAFERFVGQIEDPYTAASVLASGATPPHQLEALRALVRASIAVSDDGSRHLPVGSGVTRADNTAPSIAEATALAALALADDPEAADWLPDLGATLMASYSPTQGWGDGRSSLTCLQAVLAIFDAPLPDEVSITLKRDGSVIDEGVLNSAAMTDVLVMESALSDVGGPSTWSIEASPAVPGLGFSLSLMTWVPWEEPPENSGLELALKLPERMAAGQPVAVSLTAAVPAGSGFTITQNLPAGVQPDEDSLQALVLNNVIERYETEDGKIEVHVSSLPPGEAFAATYQVIPTLAGQLHSGPTAIALHTRRDQAVSLPPAAWRVY